MENTLLGRCRLLRKLGEGGMGVVWYARHETLQKDVAVKVLPEDLAKDAEAVERLVREARAAARLEHPNVIQVLDAGSEKGAHFIVMQYVDGTDLERIVKKKGRLPVGEALAVAKKIAQALGAAHALGIVHRDIKPANVMITKQGRVMVGDFGLARDVRRDAGITTAGQVMGTPHYLSPEQARGEELDARSDLYSLGGTLYSMLTGKYPYTGSSAMAVALKHANPAEKPEPIRSTVPDVPADVEALVAKLMAKKRDERFQTAGEVVAAIDRIKGGGATMMKVSEDQVLTPQRRRRLIFKGVGAGLGGLFLLIFLLAILGPSKEERAYREAAGASPEEMKVLKLWEVALKFPQNPWGKRAGEEAQAIRKGMLERELGPVVAAVAGGKVPFSEGMSKLDVIRGRFPDAAGEIERRENELHRARVVSRTERLAGIFKTDKVDEQDRFADFVSPRTLREEGRKSVLGGLRFWLAVIGGLGFRVESFEVARAEVQVQGRKAAVVPLSVTVFNKTKNERKTETHKIPWAWIEGDWYLPEAPK